jgi:hypothetical protein
MAMSQKTYLAYCRGEISRSKKWRSGSYDNEWRRYIDLYRGRQYDEGATGDKLIVNLIFSTINVMAPSVAVNNPRFVVNSRTPEKAPHAVITEEVLNYMWRTHRYQDEFRLAVWDALVVGHGWCKVGYKFTKPPEDKKAEIKDQANAIDSGAEFGIDDRDDVDGNVESEMYIYDDRPFLERISPFDMFVDPDARHPKEMCWIAQRVWRPVQDVQVDDRYSTTARKKVSAASWSRFTAQGNQDGRDASERADQGPKSFCEVIEFYDIKRRKICTFAMQGDDQDSSDGFLIKPEPMPYAMGHPFEMIRNYEVADQFYPVGDVSQIESLQLELNKTRSQMMMHRARFQRKHIYNKDAFDADGVRALQSDIDNTLVPANTDDLNSAVMAMPATITPSDFYDQSGLITNDIDRVSGVSDYQRGSAQTAVKRTATEAAMIQDAANARAQDRLAKIESALAHLGERVIGLMQQYLTGQQVARIVTMPGRIWVNYDPEYIQGQFDFDVAAGSTEPMNETFRRQSALQLVDASMPFLEMGVANPQALYMHILQKGFGIKDASPFLMQQGPMPQMPGMEPAVPPGMPPGQAVPGAQMPPEMAQLTPPPEPANPMDQIPPEMLMQMMGSGAPML